MKSSSLLLPPCQLISFSPPDVAPRKGIGDQDGGHCLLAEGWGLACCGKAEDEMVKVDSGP